MVLMCLIPVVAMLMVLLWERSATTKRNSLD
jgi:hypothetical protein